MTGTIIFEKERFEQTVKTARKSLGLSRLAFSREVGVSVNHMTEIENGHTASIELRHEEYAKICFFLGRPMEFFYAKQMSAHDAVYRIRLTTVDVPCKYRELYSRLLKHKPPPGFTPLLH